MITSTIPSDQGEYDVVLTSSCGTTVVSPSAMLSLCSVPTIIADPLDASPCPGTGVSLSVTPSGLSPFIFQWRKNGVPLSGAITSNYVIAAASFADEGNYDCVVVNTCGSAISQPATVALSGVPTIVQQPSSQSVCDDQPWTVSVAATGTGPITYQWRFNGADLPGATAASYTIDHVDPVNAGLYTCFLQNPCGSTLSGEAGLTVDLPPIIAQQPAPVVTCAGQAAVFTCVPVPNDMLSMVQWRKAGVAIPGATSLVYSIPTVILTDAGEYDCVLTNPCGQTTTNLATLTVQTPPSITLSPASAEVCEGGAVSFEVMASSDTPIMYQWRRNTMPVVGANTSVFQVSSAGAASVGTYDCVLTNACGSATSASAQLTLATPVSIDTHPLSQTVSAGAMATLVVHASGTGPLQYQWRRSGLPMVASATIPVVNSPNLVFLSVVPEDDGVYDCVVTGPCEVRTSEQAMLTVSCAGGGASTDCNGNQLCDALELVGMRNITAPAPASSDRFGWAVSLSGNRLLVGARSTDNPLPAGLDSGAAYVYAGASGGWQLEATLRPTDLSPGDDFGSMVALNGDWAVVAARYQSIGGRSQAGAVYIYRFSAGAWGLYQKLTEPSPGTTVGGWFGHGLEIDGDGDRIVIGAMRSNGASAGSGVAYVYRYNGVNWAREATLAPPDGATNDGFGISVAIDDPYLVVGAPYRTVGSIPTAGSAYVYFRSLSGWTLQSTLVSPTPQTGQTFGELVTIAGDHIGANSPRETVSGVPSAGAVYTFRRTDTRWTKQRRLTAQVPMSDELYGFYLTMDGDTLAVGAALRTIGGLGAAGGVEVLKRRGNLWSAVARVDSPRPQASGLFGYALALNGNRMAAGSFRGNFQLVPETGWVRVFDLNVTDCNRNGDADLCEIASGTVLDVDGNGVPDDCQSSDCPADFNDSGQVTVQDIFDFLMDYFESNLTADFNDSGVLSVQDIFQFLTSYFTGCA